MNSEEQQLQEPAEVLEKGLDAVAEGMTFKSTANAARGEQADARIAEEVGDAGLNCPQGKGHVDGIKLVVEMTRGNCRIFTSLIVSEDVGGLKEAHRYRILPQSRCRAMR